MVKSPLYGQATVFQSSHRSVEVDIISADMKTDFSPSLCG
jgi:hypothetical protein